MSFSKYDKGRPFLVITQHTTPAKGENTSVKDWGKTGKKNLQEMVIIVEKHVDSEFNKRYSFDRDTRCTRVTDSLGIER